MQTKTLVLALLATVVSGAAVPRDMAGPSDAVTLKQRAEDGNAGNGTNGANGANAGQVDFGTCTPTMDFQPGRTGRKADQFTFLPTDPVVAKGQKDALDPNIITKRICDQLTNVCGANDAAKAQCKAAQATVQALGTKDASTADAFNKALGF
ncbi:hypothetical protein MAPG_00832 [Magnaporthiopsis poae ATCC 64411]|uniref:Uncharacterized protein n=1 Tax=Magnaporthiopsis poae (strain ATCC 64411 / 73-15) TaxID=644358 RepID=A0A0C4DM32_MAGP6|nr:hypothetical protein MAPG_00832 [Magnaporthiopsis poae ATCC 64411]